METHHQIHAARWTRSGRLLALLLACVLGSAACAPRPGLKFRTPSGTTGSLSLEADARDLNVNLSGGEFPTLSLSASEWNVSNPIAAAGKADAQRIRAVGSVAGTVGSSIIGYEAVTGFFGVKQAEEVTTRSLATTDANKATGLATIAKDEAIGLKALEIEAIEAAAP